METKKINIPIDKEIASFRSHLSNHPRTIFSAKFGDGKTYFLNHFQKEYIKEYTFITLHPINYQISNNKDIFELVKRDILFHMCARDMIDLECKLPKKVLYKFFTLNILQNIDEYFIPFLSLINPGNAVVDTFLNVFNIGGVFRQIKDEFNKFKKNRYSDETINQFLEDRETVFPTQNDIIDGIICRDIKAYQNRTNKKVVLVFEDMDRLDPEHLFRIMNVISAQVDIPFVSIGTNSLDDDRNNIYDIDIEDPDETLNKYGFDNILMVLDYRNLETLFHHFYGVDTDFHGYVTKFAPRGYFSYSIREIRWNFITKNLAEISELPLNFVQNIITKEMLGNLQLRNIVEPLRMTTDSKYGLTVKLFTFIKLLNIDKKTLGLIIRNLIIDNPHQIRFFKLYLLAHNYWQSGLILIEKDKGQFLRIDIYLGDISYSNITYVPVSVFNDFEGIVNFYYDMIDI